MTGTHHTTWRRTRTITSKTGERVTIRVGRPGRGNDRRRAIAEQLGGAR